MNARFTGVTCVIYGPLPQPQYEQVIARIFVVEGLNGDIASRNTNATMNEHIAAYVADLNKQFQTGNAREHAYRPALKTLIEKLLTSAYTVINEPRHVECGAPDYMLMHKDLPVAFAEAKDINAPDLEGKAKNKEQFNRYKQSLNNLFFTDYLRFLFYYDGELTTSIRLAKIENGQILLDDSFDELHFIQTLREWAAAKPQLITTSKRLAERMASKAQLLAHTIEQSLLEDKKNDYQITPLWMQLNAFKQALVSDLDEHKFADLYAQTIAYGLFAARLNDHSPLTFSRHEAATLIPKTNPFLRDAFQHIAGYNIDKRIAWIVDDLVETFAATNMQKVMRGFKHETRQTDPILHFYEDFLRAYDPKQKKSAGVYYTPEPVVDFIVRAVDNILKNDFGLPKGLADTSKTDVEIRREEDGKMVLHTENMHRVQILDPATGTGTFLAAVVRHIKASMQGQMGAWDKYVVQHLLPRLYGFELMMAPYTIAHLKLSMEMSNEENGTSIGESDLLNDDDRLRIYLTNSLERNSIIEKTALGSIIAKEANEANLIKHDAPIMIVMGNPPYSGESKNKSKWIMQLMADYKKEPNSQQPLKEKNTKWINDDYCKFIRLAQYYVDKNKEGILAYISNNGFLDNPTFRGMRWSILTSFDEIYIVNLHGAGKPTPETTPTGEKDENVFDIQVGTTISILVKKKKHDSELAKVKYLDVYGTRNQKYEYLTCHSLTDLEFTDVQYSAPFYFFKPRNNSGEAEYNKGFKIDELFPKYSAGIVTARDSFAIADTHKELKERILDFLSISDEDARTKYNLGKDARDWSVMMAREDLKKSQLNLVSISYRPFDKRITNYTGNSKGFICMPRSETMKHMLKGNNISMITKKGFPKDNPPIFASKYISDSRFWSCSGMQGGDFVFPLYLYKDPELGNVTRIPNLNTTIWETIENWVQYGQAFAPSTSTESAGLLDFDKPEHQHILTPEQIFDYIYGVLHSPAYRTKYKEFLKVDFPRVPYPKDAEYFEHFRSFGEQLRLLHLMDTSTMENLEKNYKDVAVFNHKGNDTIEQCVYVEASDEHPSCVRINAAQTFDNIPSEVWKFYIGGYQPAQKWLKDRKGRTLSFDDIEHYRKIISVLIETDRLMKEIDVSE